MWPEIFILLVVVFFIEYYSRKRSEYIDSELKNIKEKLDKCISGNAIDLSELEDGDYENIKEIIHPKKTEKIIAILADSFEKGDDVIFIKVEPGTVVPKKFIVKGGEILPVT